MTATAPAERVAEMLASVGYRRMEGPLEVASLRFEFSAVFIGSAPSPDLIVVADTANEDEHRILSKIEGVARALDVVRSKRPLTAVLVGPRPSSPVLEAMSRVCRVLPIGVVVDDDAGSGLRNWLAVLMPLTLPEANANIAEPLNSVLCHVEGLEPDIADLILLAPRGATVIQARLHVLIAETLASGDRDDVP